MIPLYGISFSICLVLHYVYLEMNAKDQVSLLLLLLM